jgi:hypothetical protein
MGFSVDCHSVFLIALETPDKTIFEADFGGGNYLWVIDCLAPTVDPCLV